MRAIYCLITLCILSFHETTALQAGEIFGTVTDATGLGTPGVKVTVTSTRGNATWDSTTNSQGRYAFQGIEPGEYNVSVQHPGFAVQKKNNIPVRDQERAHADFTLGVKELTETIDVSDMITVFAR
ncbi:MAG: carboxypeptidase-like regulatory domain-containing protein [Terriglobia bacterium]